jgi:homoserine dehydrogenase
MNVGLIGTGVVGSGAVWIYQKNRAHWEAQSAETARLKAVCDLDFSRCPYDLTEFQRTHDWRSLLTDPEIEVVVELIGGEEPARTMIAESLQAGKHVVTANKMVLAKHGKALLDLAAENKVSLLFEAAVAGAIPVIAPMCSSLRPNQIQSVFGIVNGTTNFILTRMHQSDADFQDVLAEAQRLGYAEADPSSDIEGRDSLYKICLLAATAFHTQVSVEDVLVEGISAITAADIQWANKRGQVIKLVAMARWNDARMELRVHPVILEGSHPLAAVNDVYNAVFVRGDCCGDLLFCGRGAGGTPTASAVWADILALANRAAYRVAPLVPAGLFPKEEMVSSFRIRLRVTEQISLVAEACRVFAEHQVGILEVVRAGSGEDGELVIATTPTQEGIKSRLLEALALQPWVKEIAGVLRFGL